MRALFALLLMLMPTAVYSAEPRPFVAGSWAELLRAHAGRPTIVHFWGVTCGPCLVELPQWAKFAEEHHAAGDMVMVEAEPVEGAASGGAAVLTRAGLDRIESWTFADAFLEKLQYEVDPSWHGELPLTLLIGPKGHIRSILGSVDFAELGHWLDNDSRR